jgi:hypothetical protein
MKLHRRRFLHLTMTAGALPATSSFGWAQAYPSRPITMIVPFSAGGPTDVVTRIVAEGMKASLGQTVIIENVAGADGTIGVGRAARAAPDGYFQRYRRPSMQHRKMSRNSAGGWAQDRFHDGARSLIAGFAIAPSRFSRSLLESRKWKRSAPASLAASDEAWRMTERDERPRVAGRATCCAYGGIPRRPGTLVQVES